jgi:hydroxymethylpyrimidine/phosphomethylpyrimidine kinase
MDSMTARSVALTVAGFDPSSGAGVTADLKVFAAHGLFGVSAISALTVQSTQGVRRVEPVSGRLVRETLDCLAEDIELTGIKIGMLGSAEVVGAVVAFLREVRVPRERVVLDPVLRSSSGRELLEASGVRLLRDELLPLVGWITPNLDELAVLVDSDRVEANSVPQAARRLAALADGLNVVVTGGHLERPDDFLLSAGVEQWFPGERIETTSTHGTGCAFSSALLCRLILGDGPVEAVGAAKTFVAEAMQAAYPVGKGRGPLHHLYKVSRV